jgi:hypothetical protein
MIPVLFTNKNRQIKDAIKEQGVVICRGEIYKKTIYKSVEEFTTGFILSTPKVSVGKAKRSWNDRNQIKSFALFSSTEISLYIRLICSRTKGTQASSLLEAVVNYAKENNILSIELDALPEAKLLNW